MPTVLETPPPSPTMRQLYTNTSDSSSIEEETLPLEEIENMQLLAQSGSNSSARSSVTSRSSCSTVRRHNSADSSLSRSRKHPSLPLRQCAMHRSSSMSPHVPDGWWHEPDSDSWKERYHMASYLGSIGRFGKLYTCFSNQTEEELTVKVVRKSRWTTVQPHSYELMDSPKPSKRKSRHYLDHPNRNHLQEYSILKSLHHPNILEVIELLEDPRNYYVITDYFNPNTQSLHAYLNANGPMPESQVAVVASQIFSCVQYCHQRSIVHCNLRLDAFSISNDEFGKIQIKLTDFDRAVALCDLSSTSNPPHKTTNLRLMEPRGTLRYMAPEVLILDKSYGDRCDLWSIGIILSVLLTNTFPLDGSSFKEIQELIVATIKHPLWLIQIFRIEPHWQSISDEAKHLIHRLLAPREEDRISAEDALQHPLMERHGTWSQKMSSISEESGGSSRESVSTMSKLLSMENLPFGAIEELQPSKGGSMDERQESLPHPSRTESAQNEAMETFYNSHKQILKEWKSVAEALHAKKLDIRQSLTQENVRMAYLWLFDSKLNDSDLDKVWKEFDVPENETLDGLDFFVTVLNERSLLFTPALHEAFDVFDADRRGLVSTASFSQALKSFMAKDHETVHTPEKKAFMEGLLEHLQLDQEELDSKMFTLEELLAIILECSIPKSGEGSAPPTPESKAPERISSPSSVHLSSSWGTTMSNTSRRQSSRHASRRSSLLDRLSLKFSAKNFIAQRPGRLNHHYELNEFVNEGGCGAVWFCTHKETGLERAVKLVRKSQSDPSFNKRILDEFLIVRELDHPNILKQYELFEDECFYYIIMDAARGGDLCDELDEFGAFKEGAAALLMKQLLSCINYLHFSGYVHCDLKPENILLEENKKLSQIKVIDFGFAANIHKASNQRLSRRWGTLHYAAPEVYAEDYGKKVDVWSAGVICFLLLSDQFPFSGESNQEIIGKINEGGLDFSGQSWQNVSEEGKDFVTKLLTVDEKTRLSAAQALKHPWIRGRADNAWSEIRPDEFTATALALSNLMKFSAKNKLKQATYTLIASQLLVKKEKEVIDAVFNRLDRTCNGRLSRTEIRLALRNFLGVDLSDQQVDEVFERVDVASTGYIDYSEFVVAAMNQEEFVKTGKLKRAFDTFDVDKTGFITADNLKDALRGHLTGKEKIDNALTAKIIKEVDYGKDGVISLDEFVEAMTS